MTEPTLHFIPCNDAAGGHRMAWWQWGNPASPHLVMCVHGLTRQGRDFDELVKALLARADGNVRVVCPDVVGRGASDWLRDPNEYQLPLYAADMLALLAQLQREQPIATFDYVGTSMGGLIGMVLTGNHELPLPAPIRRLVLNDVGPVINPEAIKRISAYVGQSGRFASVADAAAAMWSISTTFGPHTPTQWMELSRHMVVPASRRSADGRAKVTPEADPEDHAFLLHYDPSIGAPLRALTPEGIAQSEAVMWSLYDGITAQTLLLRGAVSDLLSPATAQAMTQRGPRAKLVEFEGIGHAPTLVAPDQHDAVNSFLLSP
ncbi:alpha/beta hydrolase [Variovorax sp. dw_954]|uniref:alpha/beta fold hydrolase n=1 Tax=Variovorax sp. dw_954 TaxID=2720078 RepID=UPI001BD5C58D|nr:alpha/beta hydrolase [Variovorax sp. dw_954]